MPLKNIKSYIMKTINSHIVTPLIILLSLAFSLPVNAQTDDFVTTWRVAANQTITIPTYATETYNYTVNWGDGDTDTNQSSNATHTYANADDYEVRISGDFPRIHFNADSGNPNSNSIVAINQWGNQQWTSMRLAFGGATNLEGAATDRPDLSRVTDMRGMFRYAEKFNQYIGDWDVSNVENMGALFEYTDEFNQDIGDWDVSNVTNMRYMFADATAFNQDIGDWDVSNVTNNMTYMFADATAFNQDISGWDVRSVTDMASMFDGASDFSQNLGAWYISTRNLGVDPTLSAGAEVTRFTAQNAFLSDHSPVYALSGDDADLFTLTSAGVLTITDAPSAGKTSYRITITATGGSFGTDNHRDLTLPFDNKPQITSPNGGVTPYRLNHPEGTRLVTTIIATDAESSDFSYRISDTDADRAFFEINNAGELRFKDVPDYDTPHPRNGGQIYWIRVFVSDGISEISQQFKVTIIRLATPIISISTNTLVATAGTTIVPITIDSTGGAVDSYDIEPDIGNGLLFGTDTGTISGTPSTAAGLVTYVITATNDAGSATATVAITVNAAPQAPPSISISTNTLVATAGTTITPITIDETAGGMVSSYSISPNIANGLLFGTDTGTISGTPLAEAGSTTYVITATNGAGSATETVAITVNAAPQVPPSIRISTNTLVATVGTAIADITIILSGGVVDSYSIDSTLPDGLTLDTATGTISGTPTAIATLTTYTITATNTHGSAIATITITVNDVAPIISISTNTLVAMVGTAIADITIDSTGGMVDIYDIEPDIGNGLLFSTDTGTISGTPSTAAGLVTYVITATNGAGSATATVAITVNPNTAPTDIALSSTTVASSATANRRVGLLSATDIDTDVHMYTLVDGDGDTDNALFIIDGSSLRIKNTPAAGSLSYNIRIQASDGTDDHSKAFVIMVSDAPLSTDDFVTTWRVAANQTITIPTYATETYNYTVNWGDDDTDTNQSSNATHTYANAGDYEVRISGDFPRIHFNAFDGNDNSNSIVVINQWGNQQWTSMRHAFSGATDLEGEATDRPDLSRVTDMWGMFRHAESFNQDIGNWDVSNVTNMGTLFEYTDDFNQDIGDWDVSNVTNMAYMFANATAFNKDISRWDVRGVTNMTNIIDGADAFSQNLGLWYISARILGVDPVLSAGAEVTRFTAQNAVLSGHNPVYGLSGDDAGLFALTTAGVLTITNAPPAGKTAYRITITATGGSFGTDNHRDLTLPSHNPPQITSPNGGVTPYSITLPENTQLMTTIMAADVEGASDFSYRISGHDAAVFEINNAGELRFKAAYIPDYENPRDSQGNIDQSGDQQYWVNVFVFDGILETMQQIRVIITPANEAPTDIDLTSTTVARNAMPNRRVGLLSTTDPDTVNTVNTFTYTLVDGDGAADNDAFVIDGSSLKINNTPAAGSPSYNIRIQVSDGEYNFVKAFVITVGGDNPFPIDTTNFVTTWRVTAGQEITIPTHSSETYNYTVDWEDGETDTETYNGNAMHTYTHPGDYEVRISGSFPRIHFNADSGNTNSTSIVAINQWGNQQWTSMRFAFSGATNLEGDALDQPDLSRVTDMWGMFRHAEKFNQDIGDWDVSNVENMGITFEYAHDFNQDIGDWDVSNVTNMTWMFARATAFNQDISRWDVRGVTNMASMFFENMDAFSQNLGAWYITTEDATVDPTLGAGAEITTITAQNSVLSGHTPTYTLVGGADVGLFTLTSAGVLTINDVPPAGKTSYHITIAATGSFGTNNQQELTLVANHKPKITSNNGVSPYEITIFENTQQVTTITATDGDTSDTLTYTLSDDDAILFEITGTGNTRTLSFKAGYIPDYDNPRNAMGEIDTNADQEYSVLVTVSDGISPVTQQIRVTILDLVGPSISISTNTLIATVGIAITPITITENGGVVDSYSIVPPIENDLLFDTATGTISGTPTAIATLTTYTITATNRGGTDSGTITITVNGVPLTTPSISTTRKTVGPAEAASFLVSGTADAGSIVSLYRGVGSLFLSSTTATANGSWTITVTLIAGPNIFSAIATDATGNKPPSLPSLATVITLDNTAPIKPAISTATQATNTVSVTLEGVAEMGSIVQLLRSGTVIVGATTTATATDGSWTITVTLEAGANTITATATDAVGNGPSNPSDPVIITLNNRAPVKEGTIDSVTLTLSVDESKTITVRNNFNDIDGDDLFYSATSDNPNIATATATGGSVTVTSVTSGTAIITVIARDGGGLMATQTFTVTVNDVAPIIMLSTDTLVATAGTTITPITIDETAGGMVSSYSISPNIANGLSFNTITGAISGTPSMEAGSTTYVITATNGAGSATATVAITVNAAPQAPPSISISTNTLVATVGTAIADITITSSGGVVDSYSIDSILPHGLTLDTATGTISGTPTAIATLTTYTITATNTHGSAAATISITVNVAPLTTPSISTTSKTVGPAEAVSFLVSGTADVGSIVNLYRGAGTDILGSTTATMNGSWTITVMLIAGPNIFSAIATDATENRPPSLPSRELIITLDNTAPIKPAISTATQATNTVSVTLVGSAEMGSIVQLLRSGIEIAGATTTATNGSWTITVTLEAGANTITATATDAFDNGPSNPSDPVIITLNNRAPVKVGTIDSITLTLSVDESKTITVRNNFNDIDGDDLFYSATSDNPNIATATATGGSVTVTSVTSGTAIIAVIARDGGGLMATQTFTVTVNSVAPIITLSTNTLVATAGTAIVPITIDSTGGMVSSYSISPNIANGLSFDTTTGTISGTPLAIATLTTYTITATNGVGEDLDTVTITVNLNTAPTDIALSSTTVASSATANRRVGLLSATDIDTDVHMYTLIDGDGDTDNALFIIDGSSLRIKDTPAAGSSSYNIRIQASDGTDDHSKSFVITVSDAPLSKDDFVTTWRVAANQNITIPTTGSDYNYAVNWGDDNTDMNQSGNATHTYANAGNYEVRISGDFPRIYFNAGNGNGNSNRIIAINQWGNQQWTSMERAFAGATNLEGAATDRPDLSRVTNMRSMFRYASKFNQVIGGWDVSNVERMDTLFEDAADFNQDIGNWDVSNVTNMAYMFKRARDFNQDISRWDVRGVTNMTDMFSGADAFRQNQNQNLGLWYISTRNLGVDPTLSAGAEVTRFTAQNAVLSGHNPVYSLSGDDAGLFTLNSALVLTINNAPSADKTSYRITISVAAGALHNLLGSNNHHRDFILPSHNPPQITFPNGGVTPYSIMLPENTRLVTTIMATDVEGASDFSYRLSDHDAAVFEINNAGELRFKAAYIPDYENPRDSQGNIDQSEDQEYRVNVFVFDGISEDMQQIRVTITPVDEPTTDIALSSTKVARDAPANRRVGLLSSNGVDAGETYTYTLVAGDGDADNALFTIDGTSLRIKNTPAAGSLSYNIRIKVSDGTLDYSKTFTITVGGDNPFSIDTTNFVTTWRVTAGQEITIPTHSSGTYSYTVDWEDGETDTETYNGNAKHTYTHPGDYEVRISGDFPRIYFNAMNGNDNSNSIVAINQWGNQQWTSMEQAFSGATNLIGETLDRPDLSRVTDMWSMFRHAEIFNQNIGDWDVSNVERMGTLFEHTNEFNQYIGDWDVSNVTDMRWMFANAAAFNQDISGWDVRSVTNMTSMFDGASDFSRNLGAWYITTEDATVDPTLGAGAEITTITAQNSVLSGHNPTYTLAGGADSSSFTLTDGVLTINNAPIAGKTSYHITIAATGSFGTNNQQELTLVPNHKPEITSNGGVSPYAITLPENTQAVTTITATDGDTDDTLTYTLSNDDAMLFEINNAGELIFQDEYIPDYDNPRNAMGETDPNADQEYSVLVTVSDGISPVSTQQIRVTIVELLVPSISISTNTLIATVGIAITPIIITESGGVGGAVDSYSIAPPIENDLLFDTATGTISGTPTAIVTLTTYTITATNRSGTDSGTITITVNGVPLTTPSISTTSKTVGPAEAASFLVSGTADVGSIVNLYRGAGTDILGSTTATMNGSWTITVMLIAGPNIFSAIATDATENRPPSLPSRELIITLDNTAPIKPAISTATQATNTVSVTLVGVAEMGSIVQLLRSGTVIVGATTTATNGSWTITVTLEAGANTITATATDAFDNGPSNPSDPVIITLNNRAPVKEGTIDSITLTLSVDESKTITVRNNFNDIDGDDLFYSATSDNPNIATATATSGSVTVTSVGLGAAIISVIANDGGGLTATQTFTVTVNDVAPIIMLSTDTLVATAGTTITPITIDSTGGMVSSYSISPNIANGLSFNTITGAISGTPSMEAGSTTYVITATNSAGSATATVAITVNAAPQVPPSISISTNTLVATVGTAIADITITSSGGVVDSYSIGSILPHGLTLDTATGTAIISGTPTAIATLTTYTITATNTHGSATAMITITVNGVPLTTPSISTTSKTVGPAEAASFLVSGTADVGSIVNLYRGELETDILGSTTATANGSWTITVMLIAGPNIFKAIATDATENRPPSLPSLATVITLDSTKPDKPAISTATQATNTVSVTLEGSAESDSIVQLLRSGIEIAGATTTATNGSWTIGVMLEAGANTITATATDAVGNGPSNPSDPVIITLDSVAPSVTISSTSGDDGGTANTRTLSYTAIFSEGVRDFDAGDITVTGTANLGSSAVTSFSASADNSTFTFNVVAISDRSVTVSIAAGVAQDIAGNGNIASNDYALTIDSTAPGVLITTTAQSVSTESFTLTGTAEADSTVQLLRAGTVILGATATATNGTWTITVTLEEGANTFTATATDSAGNTSDATDAVIITLDSVAPSVDISSTSGDDGGTANTRTLSYTAIFSEGVSDFDEGDITVTDTVNSGSGTVISGFDATDSRTYTFNAIAPADVNVTVSIAAGVAHDIAGNDNDASNDYALTIDSIAPTVSITTSTPQSVNTGSFMLTGTAEADSLVDVLKDGSSIGTTTATNGAWTITVTLTDGANTFRAISTDDAGNTGTSGAVIITLDSVAPSVDISSTSGDDGGTANTRTLSYTAIFSEGVSDFDEGDITVTDTVISGSGTVISGFDATDSRTYTFNVVATTDGSVTVSIAAGVAQDSAGNGNTASNNHSLTIDSTAPTVSITTNTPQSVNTGSFMLTGTAEGDSTVQLLRAGTVILGATATATNGAWTITVTLVDGANTFTATATDNNDNKGTSGEVIITLDSVAPSVDISSTSGDDGGTANTRTLSYTAIFSEGVSDFDEGDITVTDTVISGSGTVISGFDATDSRTYTFNVVATTDGSVTVSIAAGVAHDIAGNDNTASNDYALTIDSIAPTVSITTSTPQSVNTESFTLTGTADAGSLVDVLKDGISIGTTTATANGAWTITVTLTDGANTFTAISTDDAGNTGTSGAVIITLDSVAPSVDISSTSGDDGGTANTRTLSYTAIFSEGVSDFDEGDITVTDTVNSGSGTVISGFDATDSRTYTFNAIAPADVNVTVSIAAGVAYDGAGNGNTVSDDYALTIDSIAPTVTISTITPQSVNTGSFMLTGTAEADSTVQLLRAGTVILGATATATNGAWTITVTLVDGANTFTATATDSTGNTSDATDAVIITLDSIGPVAVPSISISPNTLVATVGTAIQQITIVSSGGAVESYSIDSTLPAGLTLDTATGTAIISGTPTAIATLTTYTITATNSGGADTATVNITVNAVPTAPMITYRGGIANSDGTATATGHSVYVANVNPDSNDIGEDFLQRAEGTSVVDTITARNDGSSSIEYFLPTPSGAVLRDNNLFEIDRSSGVLSFKSPPDYEYPLNSDGTTQGTNQIYWAIVQVRNSGTDIKSELLLIKVEITNIDLDVSISASSGGVTETGSTDTHTVELTVDQGAEVTLSSVVHSYDPTEGGVTHTWTQVAGETVALDDASAATVAFRVPDQITETLTLSFLLTVSDDGGSDTAVFVNNTATITVTPAAPPVAVPSISISTNALVATVGTAIQQITIVSSGVAVEYSIAPAIGNGLSFSTATGTISGTPLETAGLTTYLITATNSGGTATATVNITVNAAPTTSVAVPIISISTNTLVATVGTVIADITIASSGGAVESYSIAPAIGNGLSFSTATGTISGTPLETAGLTTYLITATNSGGTATATVNITVNAAPTTSVAVPIISISTNTLVATVGTAIQQISIVSSGGAVVSYSISPTLTSGLSFDTATGTISGTPTAVAGSTTYTITATNTGGSDSTTIAIIVNAPKLNTPTATVNGEVEVSEKMIMVDGEMMTVERRTIQIEVATGEGGDEITHFYASEVSESDLQMIADKAVATGGIDVEMEPSIDSTITPTLVVNTVVDITVNEGACLANGCEVTLSYKEDDKEAGNDLYVFHYNGEKWEALPHVIRGTNTVTALADSFSPFALFNASGAEAAPAVVVPSISISPNTLVATVGSPIDAITIDSSGGGNVVSYSIAPAIGNGLSFSTATGTISGIPTAVARLATYTITATNTRGSDSATIAITVNASGADKLAKQLQADNKQLNKDILPNLVQTMLASTMSAVSTRIDATFSGTPQGSYQLDGQTVKLNGSGNLQDAMANKLPHYAKSLKNGTMDWKAMLSRSSFVLPLNAVDGDGATAGGATVWGNSEYSLVSDKGWKGDVFSLQLGVDQRMKDDLLVGGLVSWSKGDVDYTRDNKSGDYTHQITSVHPYLAWSIDDVHLWSSAGYGQGELSKKDRNGNERRSDTRLLSLSAGVSGRLSQFGQSNLNLKSDMVLAQTNIDGSADNIPADSLASQRLRLLLEIDRELHLASGGRFHPLIEIGLRYDGGGYDAGVGNSGIGAVLGLGGRYANTGLTVEGKFHTLVGRKDYKEWGVQGTIRKTSANDQGLTFSLIPSYGATGNSANQVWKQKLSDGNKSNGDYQARLDVNVGYGLFTSGGLLTPYSELRMGKNNHYRLGLRWKPNSPFNLHLYGEHKTSNDSNRILLESQIRF